MRYIGVLWNVYILDVYLFYDCMIVGRLEVSFIDSWVVEVFCDYLI